MSRPNFADFQRSLRTQIFKLPLTHVALIVNAYQSTLALESWRHSTRDDLELLSDDRQCRAGADTVARLREPTNQETYLRWRCLFLRSHSRGSSLVGITESSPVLYDCSKPHAALIEPRKLNVP